MTTLCDMPRYIRNTDAFGWQGADGPNGPWRSITPPQSGTPWQTTATPMDDLRQASAEVSGVEILSPAAQAVLTAFNDEKGWLFPREIVGSKIAAALRAATFQLSFGHATGSGIVCEDDLYALAKELESE